MHPFIFGLCATLYSVLASGQTVVPTGRTVLLNSINYYVPPVAIGKVPDWRHNGSSDELLPITVVDHGSGSFGARDMEELNARFSRKDDVFQPSFLQGIFEISITKGPKTLLT